MDYTLSCYNRERWRWWVHPLWYALLTNPDYQHSYYYTSKVDLYQSDMVRKGGGGTRVSTKRTSNATVLPSILPPSGGSGGYGGVDSYHPIPNGVVNSNSSAKVTAVHDVDDEHCPQCGVQFNSTNFRKVTESCGHAKCRSCIILSEDGCTQCETGSSASTSGSGGYHTRKSTSSSSNSNSIGGVVNNNHSNRVPTTRRQAAVAAAAAAAQNHNHSNHSNHLNNHRLGLALATNSRTNSVNSGRPTSSSPGSGSGSSSASNDTGRQTTSSVYSDSADSDSCLRFPVNDNSYHGTIDFDTMAELTSPTLPYIGLSESFASTTDDNKSYSSIVNEESEFSKGLMSLRKITEPFPLSNSNSSTSNATTIINNTSSHGGGLVTRAQLKEMPTLTLVTSSSTPPTTSIPSTSNSSQYKRPSSSTPIPTSSSGSKISGGGGGSSPDITQGVPRESPRCSSRSTVKSSSPAPPTPTPSTSKLSQLLTRSQRSSKREETPNVEEVDPLKPSSPETQTQSHQEHSPEEEEDEKAVKNEEDFMKEDDDDNDNDNDDDDDDDDDGGKGGDEEDEPVPKKKKKRSPVVIHDHITILGGDPPMYQCNLCQKKFKTKAHIKYHEFCQKGDKPFKCEQCGQGFIAKSHYEYHLRTHTGERPYVCPKCGKGFNQRGKVTRHMRSHTGEKPFICQECNRGFANAQALRSHTLIHTGERPFACTYCNKRFTGMTNLKKHVITHTGERPFSCNHCGKSFGLKWTLDLHLRTHSSERPYACDQCSRAFSNSKDLRRHLVIHSGERPFKCWICGTAFRRKDNLDRHIKNTHNQPKEVAKKLANEAAAEYLKQTTKNQSLGNIPVSKVNSVVISNIIKNADLMPAGGIVPNNLPSKNKGGVITSSPSNSAFKHPSSITSTTSKSSLTSSSASTPQVTSVVSLSAAATPSTSASVSSSSQRRRVIITAPLSPPATRQSRSSSSPSKNKSSSNSSAAVFNSNSNKPDSRASTSTASSPEKSSSRSSKRTKNKNKRNEEHESQKKKAQKPQVALQPPTPAPVQSKSSRKSRRNQAQPAPPPPPPPTVVEATVPIAKKGKSKVKQPESQINDGSSTIPRLTLVTPPSPKRENVEECENASRENDDAGDRVECILPHDIDEMNDAEMELIPATSEPKEKEVEETSPTIDANTNTNAASLDSLVEKFELSPLVQPLFPVEILGENETEVGADTETDLLLLEDSSSCSNGEVKQVFTSKSSKVVESESTAIEEEDNQTNDSNHNEETYSLSEKENIKVVTEISKDHHDFNSNEKTAAQNVEERGDDDEHEEGEIVDGEDDLNVNEGGKAKMVVDEPEPSTQVFQEAQVRSDEDDEAPSPPMPVIQSVYEVQQQLKPTEDEFGVEDTSTNEDKVASPIHESATEEKLAVQVLSSPFHDDTDCVDDEGQLEIVEGSNNDAAEVDESSSISLPTEVRVEDADTIPSSPLEKNKEDTENNDEKVVSPFHEIAIDETRSPEQPCSPVDEVSSPVDDDMEVEDPSEIGNAENISSKIIEAASLSSPPPTEEPVASPLQKSPQMEESGTMETEHATIMETEESRAVEMEEKTTVDEEEDRNSRSSQITANLKTAPLDEAHAEDVTSEKTVEEKSPDDSSSPPTLSLGTSSTLLSDKKIDDNIEGSVIEVSEPTPTPNKSTTVTATTAELAVDEEKDDDDEVRHEEEDEQTVVVQKPETTLPPEISEFVLSLLEKKTRGKKKPDDLESISSESLASSDSEDEEMHSSSEKENIKVAAEVSKDVDDSNEKIAVSVTENDEERDTLHEDDDEHEEGEIVDGDDDLNVKDGGNQESAKMVVDEPEPPIQTAQVINDDEGEVSSPLMPEIESDYEEQQQLKRPEEEVAAEVGDTSTMCEDDTPNEDKVTSPDPESVTEEKLAVQVLSSPFHEDVDDVDDEDQLEIVEENNDDAGEIDESASLSPPTEVGVEDTTPSSPLEDSQISDEKVESPIHEVATDEKLSPQRPSSALDEGVEDKEVVDVDIPSEIENVENVSSEIENVQNVSSEIENVQNVSSEIVEAASPSPPPPTEEHVASPLQKSPQMEESTAVEMEETTTVEMEKTCTVEMDETAAMEEEESTSMELEETAAVEMEEATAMEMEESTTLEKEDTATVAAEEDRNSRSSPTALTLEAASDDEAPAEDAMPEKTIDEKLPDDSPSSPSLSLSTTSSTLMSDKNIEGSVIEVSEAAPTASATTTTTVTATPAELAVNEDEDDEEVNNEDDQVAVAPKPEATLPPEISEFVLSVLEKKTRGKKKPDDLESISSESLASPQSEEEMENSIKMCIQTLETDIENDDQDESKSKPPSNPGSGNCTPKRDSDVDSVPVTCTPSPSLVVANNDTVAVSIKCDLIETKSHLPIPQTSSSNSTVPPTSPVKLETPSTKAPQLQLQLSSKPEKNSETPAASKPLPFPEEKPTSSSIVVPISENSSSSPAAIATTVVSIALPPPSVLQSLAPVQHKSSSGSGSVVVSSSALTQSIALPITKVCPLPIQSVTVSFSQPQVVVPASVTVPVPVPTPNVLASVAVSVPQLQLQSEQKPKSLDVPSTSSPLQPLLLPLPEKRPTLVAVNPRTPSPPSPCADSKPISVSVTSKAPVQNVVVSQPQQAPVPTLEKVTVQNLSNSLPPITTMPVSCLSSSISPVTSNNKMQVLGMASCLPKVIQQEQEVYKVNNIYNNKIYSEDFSKVKVGVSSPPIQVQMAQIQVQVPPQKQKSLSPPMVPQEGKPATPPPSYGLPTLALVSDVISKQLPPTPVSIATPKPMSKPKPRRQRQPSPSKQQRSRSRSPRYQQPPPPPTPALQQRPTQTQVHVTAFLAGPEVPLRFPVQETEQEPEAVQITRAPQIHPPKFNGIINNSNSSGNALHEITPKAIKRKLEDDSEKDTKFQRAQSRIHFYLPEAKGANANVPPNQNHAESACSTTAASAHPSQNQSNYPNAQVMAFDPSRVYFVQPDGRPVSDYQILYASAQATVEDSGSVDGPPSKVRLIYAEAVGVNRNSENEYIYTSTTPDQVMSQPNVEGGPYQVQLMEPYHVSYPPGGEGTSRMLQYQTHPQSQNTIEYQQQQYSYSAQQLQSQQQQQPPPPSPVYAQSQQQQQQQPSPQYYHNSSQHVHSHAQNSQQQQQQQVLNLSVNSNPVYYQRKPVQEDQAYFHQQMQMGMGQYATAPNPTPKVESMSSNHNHNQYNQQQQHQYQQPQQQQQQPCSSQIHPSGNNVEAEMQLPLPVYYGRQGEKIGYAHVHTTDPTKQRLLERAHEIRHLFPPGAFRHHYNPNMCYQNQPQQVPVTMPNGHANNNNNTSHYSNNGSSSGNDVPPHPPPPPCSLSASNNNNNNSNISNGTVHNSTASSTMNNPKSGLELLTEATERMKALQSDAYRTERAAAAIAAVGELARLRRFASASGASDPNAPDANLTRMQCEPQQPLQQPPPQPQLLQTHSQLPLHPQLHQHPNNVNMTLTETMQPPTTQQGIRRGPRKYYLSRSANQQE